MTSLPKSLTVSSPGVECEPADSVKKLADKHGTFFSLISSGNRRRVTSLIVKELKQSQINTDRTSNSSEYLRLN